ncbi:MAG: GntR family transcriptional regulator [Phycisphaerales bacterium]|nr:GntR family transcriptional regulator [Phycisphaerales bacterium]
MFLPLKLEPSSGVALTRQMIDQLRGQIVSSTLKAGERLPSVRQLAGMMAVNQNSVLRVYERLTMEGFLERRHGDGTYVAQRLPEGEEQQKEMVAQQLDMAVRNGTHLSPKELHVMLDEALRRANTTTALELHKLVIPVCR